ncbi:fatty acid-binding protein, intestinal-like isoform X4 [Microcaecilia unicolor]|uniref:Fatty acid-binding protein, intestinal-like isoform X4 n=1 Tax=Microcaecilia unicolor TaxID=1415580 RepID=A0A6P7XAP4_9AMPH|nr:fatty acid-binding protein, intestinal-like isoform X4 [Microcaecilia unicolor]
MSFDGTWKVDRSDNYEKFLEKMGVDVPKLAAHDNMKLKIKQNGKQISVYESSDHGFVDMKFRILQVLVEGDWKLDGDIIEGNFTRKDNKKVLKTKLEIVGGELMQTNLYEGVEAKRIFKRE